MADRRIEQSRLLRQRLARSSVHYASTPTLTNIDHLDGSNSSEGSTDTGYYDTSSASNSSENGGGVYQRMYETRWIRKQKSEYSDYGTVSNISGCDIIDDLLAVTEKDVSAIEGACKGHKTKAFVCKSLANLYTCPKISTTCNQVSNWILTYTGVPVLLLDLGNTRSRTRRQIQLLLIEKGTCFILWKDVVDNLTTYTSTQDGLFHTFHLSTDHSVRLGLSFDNREAATEFHEKLLRLTSEPENIALSGPRWQSKSHYYLDNIPEPKSNKRRGGKPNKMDISQPCRFQHVVSVSQADFKKYFSLQTFVDKPLEVQRQSGRRKKPPAPPPPQTKPLIRTSSVSCHNIYALN